MLKNVVKFLRYGNNPGGNLHLHKAFVAQGPFGGLAGTEI